MTRTAAAHRLLAVVAGGAVGLLSLTSLLLGYLTEASCDATCGRSTATMYVSGLGGLVGCLGLAAALQWRAPSALGWLAIVAGMVSWGVGVATW